VKGPVVTLLVDPTRIEKYNVDNLKPAYVLKGSEPPNSKDANEDEVIDLSKAKVKDRSKLKKSKAAKTKKNKKETSRENPNKDVQDASQQKPSTSSGRSQTEPTAKKKKRHVPEGQPLRRSPRLAEKSNSYSNVLQSDIPGLDAVPRDKGILKRSDSLETVRSDKGVRFSDSVSVFFFPKNDSSHQADDGSKHKKSNTKTHHSPQNSATLTDSSNKTVSTAIPFSKPSLLNATLKSIIRTITSQ
jgi:hypothetical protein